MTRSIALAILAVVLAGCGGSDDDGGASEKDATSSAKPANQQRDAELTAAMEKWAQASTPELVCAELSSGFKRFLTGGKPCGKNATKKLATLRPKAGEDAKVVKIRWMDPQAEVTAELGDRKSNTYFFVKDGGTWKLNSIGMLVPLEQ